MNGWALWIICAWSLCGIALWDWIMIVSGNYKHPNNRRDVGGLFYCIFLGPIGVLMRILSYTDRTGRPWRHVFGHHNKCGPWASCTPPQKKYQNPSGPEWSETYGDLTPTEVDAAWDEYYEEKYG